MRETAFVISISVKPAIKFVDLELAFSPIPKHFFPEKEVPINLTQKLDIQ